MTLKTEDVDSAKVAVVIIDPWNYHWCMTACQRVSAMAPRWNRALQCARELGIQILWAPTEAASQYAGTPQRERAAAVNLVPVPRCANPVLRFHCRCRRLHVRAGHPLRGQLRLGWHLL